MIADLQRECVLEQSKTLVMPIEDREKYWIWRMRSDKKFTDLVESRRKYL